MDSIASADTLEITTAGRRTGKPHTATIWFVVHDGKVYVSTDDLSLRDWARNLVASPEVTVVVADRGFRGQGRLITDEALRSTVAGIRSDKYHGAFMEWTRVYFEISLEESGRPSGVPFGMQA